MIAVGVGVKKSHRNTGLLVRNKVDSKTNSWNEVEYEYKIRSKLQYDDIYIAIHLSEEQLATPTQKESGY